MRAFIAALALACALLPLPAPAAEATVRLAQMARDVTDAVRKQRAPPRERPRPDERTKREGNR